MKINSPIGSLWLAADASGLTKVSFTELPESEENMFIVQAKQQLEEYFDGSRQNFTVPLSINKGTLFQQSVWQALTTIPYGQTWSYLDVAQALNNPKAVRAIGQANSKNPLPIIIPCHRVIGRNGKLTGYFGSNEAASLAVKQFLLDLEKENRQSSCSKDC
jgi:methylated-DNA-[protein]-cysteine S-methyltransferase